MKIEVTIDGEPAEHRTLELLERGIEELKAKWEAAYATLANEMPHESYLSGKAFDYVLTHRDELTELEEALLDAKRDFILRRDFGTPKGAV